MRSLPLISVVIPFYSNCKWLEEAIESVKKQTYSCYEIIVIDDGSFEDINSLKKKFKDVAFYRQNNAGAGSARNYGIEKSRGEYIAFLDSDDLWAPEKLEKQYLYMNENNLLCSHTDYIRFWDQTSKEKYVSANIFGRILPKCIIWNPIATPCVMIKRELLVNSSIRFREGKMIGEDSFMWQRIAEVTDWGYLKEALTFVRIRNNNAAFNFYLQLEDREKSIVTLKKYKSLFSNSIIYYYCLWSLSFCRLSRLALSFIFSKIDMSYSQKNILSALFYSFPYLNLFIIRKIM